ncbi:MAG TPA: glutamine amidotransferase [Candidatus Saccharimonadales bacterium]|nr:glutamine amidotransferase [Candidatus Saccharimonadales bacterium]
MSQQSITILHLYPRELNIYGDRGNIQTLVRRLEWRGISAKVVELGIGDEFDMEKADIIFGGGGQDRGQIAVGHDLQRHKRALTKAAEALVPMLTICGTYQLFGRGFTTLDGDTIPGIGIFKAHTTGSRLRMIGNAIVETEFGRLVGFENHSGRTHLESGQEALGRLKQGYGNDGRSGKEGARAHNVFGTYLHGPILPKNPALADELILAAMRNKYGVTELSPVEDSLELLAAKSAAKRPQ